MCEELIVVAPQDKPFQMTPQQFLEWEKTQENRYEYVNGYVLVSSNEPLIEVCRRNSDGTWQYIIYESGNELRLESLEFTCAIDEIYESIVLDEVVEEPFDVEEQEVEE